MFPIVARTLSITGDELPEPIYWFQHWADTGRRQEGRPAYSQKDAIHHHLAREDGKLEAGKGSDRA